MTCGPDRAEAEHEAAVADEVATGRGLGDSGGRPGEDVDDPGADLDPFSLRGQEPDLADRVERVGLWDPDQVEPGLLQLLDPTHVGVEVAGVN